jgi:hypothetical protein
MISRLIQISALLVAVALFLSGCGGGGGGSAPAAGAAPQTPRTESVARIWNESLLEAIRNDRARPTVHARNLFHLSAAMYDAWSAIDGTTSTYLLGKQIRGYNCGFDGFPAPGNDLAAQEEAVSYAAFRLLEQRFGRSSLDGVHLRPFDVIQELGFDPDFESTDYSGGSAAALGNYIASCYIGFGGQDGSNEANNYSNVWYEPVNPGIDPELPGNPDIVDLDRWQPVLLILFIGQSGIPDIGAPPFIGAEWGQVEPFALSADDLTIYQRDGFDYWVYHDPGLPPTAAGPLSAEYKWGFALVSVWSAHLDPADGVMMDISPASLGNVQMLPASIEEYRDYYDLLDGGDPGTGYPVNPATGAPYEPQMVPRGDYARVLAEFWADGPDSETPPGHWFVILNSVHDHPDFERRMEGAGPELDPLEWDIKAYFALGGTMHDSAIAAWGAKGWYDYIRPLSAIRAMADRGQSSDPFGASYSADGISLIPGYIELVEAGDPLAGAADEHVGKIKLLAWRGPEYVDDPMTDLAGVGWILAENWWPYQRPTFVTPPFAGYVSGHSTFSRAAANVLTALTGNEYFPGGMSSFEIEANEFLVFEEGPSVDMTLQWATYRDASDQTSLSRLWGGIHPPADDIPGRIIGDKVAVDSFELAKQYFNGDVP